MHNLHLAVVTAETSVDACQIVETHIEGYGNENNWYTISGSVSEENEVYINDVKGRFNPEVMELTTIDLINEYVRKDLHIEVPEIINDIKAGKVVIDEIYNPADIYDITSFLNAKKRNVELGDRVNTFDVLTNEYNNTCYDEFGVTNIDYNTGSEELVEGEKKYVVFIDMHS